ncbi:MAG: APC superfamily amino acid-polyamine translocator [Oceanicaulis sp. HLUCCA04]|nr:MAG: APC superfamily amino acid-polyamine translocator [Oceanicaulis sp. HLUCCA04]
MTGNEKLERQITAWGIWLLAVNGMIGAGIFAVPGGAAALVGVWSPLVYVACALLLGLIVACYAELASRFTSTGGPVLYVRTAFGRFAGFQTGLAVYATRITAFAANVNLMVASIAFFVPALSDGPLRILVIVAIIAVLAGINIAGAKPAMRAMGLLTVLKFLPLLAIALVGLFHINPEIFPGNSLGFPQSAQWSAAVLLVIYAFVGWEAAVIPAGETREPGTAMPLGLFWALGVVVLLYVVIQIVCVAVVPDLASSERALVDAGAILFGPAGALLLTLGVIVSVGGNITGTVVTTPRLTYALALEKTLPAWFGKVDERTHVPANSIIFFAVLATILAVVGDFFALAAMSAFVRVLIYVGCIAAMPRVRALPAETETPMRLPLGWTIPVLAVLGSLVLLSQVPLRSMAITAAFLVAAALVYAVMQFLNARRA